MFTVQKYTEKDNRFVAAHGWGKWGVTPNVYRIYFSVIKKILKLIMVIVVELCEYTKNHWAVYFGLTVVCKLYLNKVVIKKKRIRELEDRSIEIIQPKEQKENWLEKKNRISETCRIPFNYINICIRIFQEGKEREKWAERIFEEIMSQKLQNLRKVQ